MNEYISKIQNILHSIQKRPVVYVKEGIRPHRDWIIIFFGALTVLCISGIWAYYIYVEVTNGTLFTSVSEDTKSSVKIDMTLLQKISKRLDAKDARARDLSSTPQNLPDPSL